MTHRVLLLLSIFVYLYSPLGFCESSSLIARAKQANSDAFDYAIAQRAEIEATSEGEGFTVWWTPPRFNPQTTPVLVSLHGQGEWAVQDFKVWHQEMKKRGWAYLGIQWWNGKSLELDDYALPQDIYLWAAAALEQHHIPRGHSILLGDGMGSANSYGVTYFDHLAMNPHFAITIANAGAMEKTYPVLHQQFFTGLLGEKPFENTKWILYCSMNDEENENACTDMEQTKIWLKGFGATVELFIQDPKGPHIGFMHPTVRDQALDLATKHMKK